MITELLIENVILPFGQSFLYDISKAIYNKIHDRNRLFLLLNKAIIRSVKKAIPYGNPKMIDAIAHDICEECEFVHEVTIFKILNYQFNEWNEENLNAGMISAEIYSFLTAEIMAEPDLCVLFSYKLQIELISEFVDMQSKVGGVQNIIGDIQVDISQLREKTDLSYRLLLDIINSNLKFTENIRSMMKNNKFISLSYQDYFTRPLFLEKRTKDGKVATLNDVYIENKFKILDFKLQNEKKVYQGIIKFIEDFIKGNLRTMNYGTKYSFSSNDIKVLFIKGHPGSGKSSLFYFLAYLKSHDVNFMQDYNFYFIKLIELFDANNGQLNAQNPMEDIKNHIGKIQPYENTVLILDGLDEICVARNFDINEYCYNLIRTISIYKMHIIITTRLNYIKISHNDNKNVFNIQINNLDAEDLSRWVEKYFNIHNLLTEEKLLAERNINFIRKNENNQLNEILAIPLLFYMIVASSMDISKVTSIGELYDYVFDELKERNYNEEEFDFKQKHAVSKRIPVQLARQIAVEISKKMYNKNMLLLKINSKDLQEALNEAYSIDYSLKEDDKKEIEKLFPITFFYKEAVDVVEFAHKSIMEFFVAEKLYQIIREFEDDIDVYITKYMLEPIITNEILDYYTYFFNTRDSRDIIEKHSNILSILKQVICQKKTYHNENVLYSYEISKVVFKIYWYFIRKLIRCKNSDINEFINEDIFRKYILGILSIKDSGSVTFLDSNYIIWDFKSLLFCNYSFSYCNIEFSDFSYSAFDECIFMYSNLENCNFDSIILKSYIKFTNCSMKNIKIRNIQVDEDIRRKRKENNQNSIMELRGVSLENAVFENLDMRLVNIVSCISMKNAKFSNVELTLRQLLEINKFSVSFENIRLHISIGDITKNEKKEIKNKKRENMAFDTDKYIDELVIDKIIKSGCWNDIISNLTIMKDEYLVSEL